MTLAAQFELSYPETKSLYSWAVVRWLSEGGMYSSVFIVGTGSSLLTTLLVFFLGSPVSFFFN